MTERESMKDEDRMNQAAGKVAAEKRKAVLTGIVFPLILLLYPMRHIHWGLDLMDTGYNYANFRFMGMEHMDPMWLFSTYLANALGWLMTRLPFGGTLLGMNFYTAITVCLLALLGYWFCVRRVGMSPIWAFLGEFLAISLCWSPTAVLYNYLTYVLFLGGSVLLYRGLAEDRNPYLVLAGVCLGANVLTRFSNLPEMGMIVAVWAYAIICRRGWKKVLGQTGWCLLGYLAALGVLLGWIGIRYGLSEYVNGIIRLFGMTENAPGYTPTSMIMESIRGYVDNLYWVIRLGVILCAGEIGFAVLPERFQGLKKLGFAGITCLAAVWLYARKFCSVSYQDYDSMLRPGILFLMLAMLIGIIQIFRPKAARQEKLLSGMVILIILITPLGSNNHLLPALNNLFLVAPYVFWMLAKFCRSGFQKSWQFGKWKIGLSFFPVKAIAVMLAVLMLVQGVGFGLGFVFVEGDGAENVQAAVTNNKVLSGIRMSAERAEWMTGITARLKGEGNVLEYDGLSVETGPLDEDGLTPVSALPALLEAAEEGYLTACTLEEDGSVLRVDCGDPEGTPGTGVETTLWFDAASHALTRGEITVDGFRAISCEFSDFTMG